MKTSLKLSTLATMVAVVGMLGINTQAAPGPKPEKKSKVDPLTISCLESTIDTISLRVKAGKSGALAGFSIQWITCEALALGPDGTPDTEDDNTWPPSDSLCKASFSGNANATQWNLGEDDYVDIEIGALSDADPGVSFSCNELECSGCYRFRAFAHAFDKLQRSEFSDTSCSTDPCGPEEFEDGDFCSFSQGGYGGPGTPFVTLSEAFGTVYPVGITIGGTKNVTFTSAEAVQNYLPAGGPSGQFTGTFSDPANVGVTGGGNLAGQVLTLRISVDLSAEGITPTGFGDLVLHDTETLVLGGAALGAGTQLNDESISEVLAAAEEYLGGGALPYGLTTGQLNDLVSLLNLSFDTKYAEFACGSPSAFAKAYLAVP